MLGLFGVLSWRMDGVVVVEYGVWSPVGVRCCVVVVIVVVLLLLLLLLVIAMFLCPSKDDCNLFFSSDHDLSRACVVRSCALSLAMQLDFFKDMFINDSCLELRKA